MVNTIATNRMGGERDTLGNHHRTNCLLIMIYKYILYKYMRTYVHRFIRMNAPLLDNLVRMLGLLH